MNQIDEGYDFKVLSMYLLCCYAFKLNSILSEDQYVVEQQTTQLENGKKQFSVSM